MAKRCLAKEPENRPADAAVVTDEVSKYLNEVEQKLQQRLRDAEIDRTRAEVKADTEAMARAILEEQLYVNRIAVGVAYSPDGRRLASASWDHTVKVWRTRNGKELLTLKGHRDRVQCVAFSPDGSRIASASEDTTVRIWDVSTGRQLLPVRRHRGLVCSVAFSPDGERIAAGIWSPAGWVKTWDAQGYY